MTILVAGGAGYIGSHTVKELIRNGHSALIFDNFSSGHRTLVPKGEIIEGDLRDKTSLRDVFQSHNISAVMHFASLIQVGESYIDPQKYYTHNLICTMNLLETMLEFDVKRLIFSSSAAVYGNPERIPITEDHPLAPANPYGQTKLWVERILESYHRAYGLDFISLRYFNAAGADSEGEMGEIHYPETHLIPNICLFLLGRKKRFELFGRDFPTPDGTAVRDYIHVTDLASAHVLALEKLKELSGGSFINLGTNKGYSVLEVIKTAEKVTEKRVSFESCPRRKGDVPVLLASWEKAAEFLAWEPRFSDLEAIIRSAWKWHKGKHGGPSEPVD